jgi:hypothetical protein
MLWPLDEGAACLLCVCAPWTRVRHTEDCNASVFLSSGLRPHHVCVKPITISVQGEEGCEGNQRAGESVGTEACVYVVGGGMGMACVGSQDGAIAPQEA